MSYTWITQALCAGGKLTVASFKSGKSWLRAEMLWDGCKPLRGGYALSVNGALDKLEAVLNEDAAAEHLRNSGL